jgi:methyltransferase
MTVEPVLGHAIVAAVALQRLAELPFATANARRLAAAGGVVVERDATLGMVLVQVGLFAGLAWERLVVGVRMDERWAWALGAAFVAVEALRAWTLSTLGRRWTIRVVVVPGERPIARGPYRFLRHPNYVVLALEIVVVPLLVGAWWTAAALVLPQLAVIAARVRVEEKAWQELATGLGRGGEGGPSPR